MHGNLSLQSLRVNKTMAIPVGVVVLIIAAIVFYVLPTWAKYQDTEKSIAQQTNTLQQLQTKAEELQNLNDDELKTDLTEVQAALPEQKNVVGVIAGVSRIAQETGTTIQTLSVKPGNLASDSASQEVTMDISLAGNLTNVDAFMKKVEQVRRILGIQKYTGTSGLTDNDFISSIELSFYTMPISNSLGTSFADPLPDFGSDKKDLIAKLSQYPVYTDVNSFQALQAPSPTPSVASASAKLPAASAVPSATASAH